MTEEAGAMVRAPTSAWLRWSSRVAAPEDAVRAAVEAVAIRELRLLARTPGGWVVAVSDTEASLRVVVVLRADGKGTEVVVLAGGQDVSSDLVRASLLAVPFVMCGIAGSYGESVAAAVLPLLFGGALLLYTLVQRVLFVLRRRGEFMRAAAIVHRAVAPLLPSEGALYRAIAAGTGGAVEEQGGGKRRL